MRRRRRSGSVLAAAVVMSLVTIASCSSNPVVLPTTVAAPSSSLALAPTVVASTAPPRVAATPSTVSSTTAATTVATSAAVTSTTVDAATSTTPPSTQSPLELLDPSDVDADVVVHAFDTLTFDQESYSGKADLTLGLFDQGTMPHTLLIEGRSGFRLEVSGRGDSSIGDVVLRRGTYTIYCELPGHRAGGMEAELVIS